MEAQLAAPSLDPYDRANVADPQPAYAALRAHAPVHHVVERDLWVLSRFDDVAAGARDPLRFSSAETNGRSRRRVAVVAGVDPPEHTRLRQPAAAMFTARRLAPSEERSRSRIETRLRQLATNGGEFVGTVSEPVACELVAEIIGAPSRSIAALRRGRGLAPSPRAALHSFFTGLVAARRREPAEDLVSGLLADGTLDEDEIARFCTLLLAAGIDTTRDLVSNAFIELAEHPEQWELLASRPSLVDSAVEELIRFTSPIQAMFRTATADVVLPGGSLPAGARVMLLFGSANRDERRWHDAATLDLARYAGGQTRASHHLAFGGGPHACLGAWLARRVAGSVLTELVHLGRRPLIRGPVVRGANPSFRTVVSANAALG